MMKPKPLHMDPSIAELADRMKQEERAISSAERQARTFQKIGDISYAITCVAVANAIASLGRPLGEKDRERIAQAELRRLKKRTKRRMERK